MRTKDTEAEERPKSDLEKFVEALTKFETALEEACIDKLEKIEEGLRKIWKI